MADRPTEGDDPVLERLARDVTLSQGAKQGATWLGSSRVIAQGFQFAVSLITARLLLPSEFGEAAIVLAFANFAMLFTDLGSAPAVVHAEPATTRVLATAFWLNLGSGLVLTALVSAIAIPVAALYGNSDLAPLLMLSSLSFAVSCAVVHRALLERTFHYRQLATVELAAQVIGLSAVPLAAVAGLGSASLVIGPLLTVSLTAAGLWFTVPWRPHGRPGKAEAGELWRYSRGILGFNSVNYWARNADTLMLGATASTNTVGEYNRAFTLTMIPIQQMSLVVGRVLFPALTRLRHDPERLGRAWVRGLRASMAATLPVAITLSATAPALVPVLYGPNWDGTIPILQILALSAIPQILAASSGAVYRALGRNDLLLKVGLINAILAVVAIAAGLPWGAVGVATALLLESFIAVPIAVVPIARIVGFRVTGMLPVVWPALALAGAQVGVAAVLGDGIPDWVVLVAQLVAGGLAYLAVWSQTDRETFRAVMGRVQAGLRAIRR